VLARQEIDDRSEFESPLDVPVHYSHGSWRPEAPLRNRKLTGYNILHLRLSRHCHPGKLREHVPLRKREVAGIVDFRPRHICGARATNRYAFIRKLLDGHVEEIADSACLDQRVDFLKKSRLNRFL